MKNYVFIFLALIIISCSEEAGIIPDYVLSAEQKHNKFSSAIPPVIRVSTGSVIKVDTHEASDGQLHRNANIDDLKNIDFGPIHPLTGPVYIDEAEVGDILAVDLLEIELHDVPYEVYTIEQVRLTFRKMSLMTPENIDAWGYLHWGSGDNDKTQLLGERLPIPRHLSTSKCYEEEEVIAISDAQTCLDKCPECKQDIPFGTILLVTENFRLLPAQCCSKMIWSQENLVEDNEDWV